MRLRAGAQVLLMATNPIKREILQQMVERPIEAGPGREYRVTGGGREVLFVGFVAERWLQSAPQGPLPLDSREAERAVSALVESWSATVIHMLAREPHTLQELQDAVDGVRRQALLRHLAAMQDAGLVVALPGGSAGEIYAVTDWLRAAVASLVASARLERRKPQESMAPIEALDVEAGFQLSLPLLELPRELSGTCRLGVNLTEDESSNLTGVTARIEQGRVVACTAGLEDRTDAWAAGTAGDWLDTVIEPEAKKVRSGGDRWLARALLIALHKTLFGVPVAEH